MNEIQAWHGVRATLRGVLDELNGQERELGAPLLVRMASIRLRAAALEQGDAVREKVGEAEPDAITGAIAAELAGQPAPIAVLEALSPGVRSEALAEVREAIDRDPGHVPALRVGSALAQLGGRWQEAAEWLERLAGADPKRADALVSLGDIYWSKLGQAPKALKFLKLARNRNGDDPELLDKLLKLHLELEEWEPAIATCNTLIGQGGRAEMTVTYMLTLGEIHIYGLREPGAALVYYLDALRALPQYALTYTLLQELLDGNEWADFEAHFEALEPETLEPYDALLKALRDAKGDGKTAVAGIREVLGAGLADKKG